MEERREGYGRVTFSCERVLGLFGVLHFNRSVLRCQLVSAVADGVATVLVFMVMTVERSQGMKTFKQNAGQLVL